MRSLDVNRRLIEALDRDGVLFAHWKSNYFLERGLVGQADLDLLVDISVRADFEVVTRALGFVRLRSPRIRELPNVEHHLGFDAATGSSSHLHVHYALVMGEQRVKGHHPPLEAWLLTDVHRIDGVPVPAPEKELFLLYLRVLMKATLRRTAATAVGRRAHALPDRVLAEGRWLLRRAETFRPRQVAVGAGFTHLQASFAEFVTRLADDRFPARYVLGEKRRVLRAMRPHRRQGAFPSFVRRVHLGLRYARPLRPIRPLPMKRLLATAPVVKLVGADGSGKTSLARDLTAWLGWKLDVVHLYFGQPKSSPVRQALRRTRYGIRELATTAPARSLRRRLGDRGTAALAALEWISIARRRRRGAERAARLASQGTVVLAERFPLPEVSVLMETPMDGPRLGPDAPFRAAAREARIYDQIRVAGPTYLLVADYATLRSRRPHMDEGELRAKVEACQELARRGGCEVVDVARPYAEVLLDLKGRIWRLIEASA